MSILQRGAVAAALLVPLGAGAADSAELAEIKRMIEAMRADYEARIEALEDRLEAAERDSAPAPASAEAAAPARGGAAAAGTKGGGFGAVTSGTAFNPAVSVILDGNFYTDDIDGEGAELFGRADGIHHVHGAGHDHGGHGHGGAERGFNLRSAEIAFSATVDPYFDAFAYLNVSEDGDVDLEEAYFRTRSLPAGLAVKGGKFLSDIGYVNRQHPHQWDFVDQNLVYLNLLGDHGIQDNGVQLTWLPDLPVYTLLGVELLQGEQERLGALAGGDALDEVAAAIEAHAHEEEHDPDDDHEEHAHLGLDDEDHGPRLITLFGKVSPDLGYDHALQLGAWAGYARQHQEIHGDPHDEDVHALQGDAWMWGLDAVYKYDSPRSYGARDLKLQSEYLWQRKDLDLTYHQARPGAVGDERQFTQDGFYLQGVYGIAPRWQAGLRYDVTGWTNELESGGDTLREWDESDRWTAALTWTPSEFSRVRLQYAHADIVVDGESEELGTLYVQFLMSLGAHGAHEF